MRLSIIIPVYNEEKRLPKTFDAINRFCAAEIARGFEVVFVDDGSVDGTQACIRQFSVRFPQARFVSHKKNIGKGAAVRTGMLAARGDYRLMIDADMATDLLEFRKFLPILNAGAEVVIGSRRVSGAEVRVHQPYIREFMGSVYTKLANIMTGAHVSDFTCGFKCFNAIAAYEIFSRSCIARWSYDAEILFLARKLRFEIVEVPIVWNNDGATRVRIWKDAPRSFFDLFFMRFLSFVGKYDWRR